MNIANLITLTRFIVFIPLTLYFVIKEDKILAIVFYLIFIFLDFLDGFTARKLKCETKLGKNLDLIADITLILSVSGVLIVKGIIPLLYLILVSVPILIFAFSTFIGVSIAKDTYMLSKWSKINGFVSFLTPLLFLINNKVTIALTYVILVYVYVSAIKYTIEIQRVKKA